MSSSSSSSSTAGKRAYQSGNGILDISDLGDGGHDVDYDEEFTHRFSKLRPNIDEKKERAKLLDAAHGKPAVRKELEGAYKEALDARARFRY